MSSQLLVPSVKYSGKSRNFLKKFNHEFVSQFQCWKAMISLWNKFVKNDDYIVIRSTYKNSLVKIYRLENDTKSLPIIQIVHFEKFVSN